MVLPAGLTPPQAIEAYGITATMTPPARLHRTLRSNADLRSLRAVLIGGSPAGPQLLRAATERLGPVVWQGYGQGEAGVIAMLTPEDIAAGHDASVGRPLPAVEVAIRDGEVCVRSPHMMAGYWNDPEQTAEVLRDGWLHTRDLGRARRRRVPVPDRPRPRRDHGQRRGLLRRRDRTGARRASRRGRRRMSSGCPIPATGEAIHAFVVPAGERVPDRGGTDRARCARR